MSYFSDQQTLAREAAVLRWNSLTPRQQYLEKQIDAEQHQHRLQHNCYIPINDHNLLVLIKITGATEDEESYVLERMQVYEEIGQHLQEGEDFIQHLKNQGLLPKSFRF